MAVKLFHKNMSLEIPQVILSFVINEELELNIGKEIVSTLSSITKSFK